MADLRDNLLDQSFAAIDARARAVARQRVLKGLTYITAGAIFTPATIFLAACGFAAGLPLLGLTYAVAAVSIYSAVSIALER